MNKAQVQIEDIIWKRSFKAVIFIFLTVLNRRRVPFPTRVFEVFNRIGENNTDMGDENFLAEYMVPSASKCYVDVGAATGGWSIFVGQQGYAVYAFEPSPKAFGILSVRARTFSNIHVFPYALGDKDSTGRLGLTAASLSGTMDEEVKGLRGGGTIDITVRRLDSIDLPAVGVIKIDTEGYEHPILLGAQETILKNKPRLIIEVHKGSGKAAETFREEISRIISILRTLNYTWHIFSRRISLRDIQPFIIAEP